MKNSSFVLTLMILMILISLIGCGNDASKKATPADADEELVTSDHEIELNEWDEEAAENSEGEKESDPNEGKEEWVRIPAGFFAIGANDFDPGYYDMMEPEIRPDSYPNEAPRYMIELTNDFEMKSEVITTKEFEEIMGFHRKHYALPDDLVNDDDYPPETDKDLAMMFLNRYSESRGYPGCFECSHDDAPDRCLNEDGSLKMMTGMGHPGHDCLEEYLHCDLKEKFRESPYDCPGYRLPTNAEWEYAARAGASYSFPAPLDNLYFDEGGFYWNSETCEEGSIPLSQIAWYCANSDHQLHPVGLLAPNHWGLYDVLGNNCELVSGGDYYPDAHPSRSILTDPVGLPSEWLRGGPSAEEDKVRSLLCRGGGFHSKEIFLGMTHLGEGGTIRPVRTLEQSDERHIFPKKKEQFIEYLRNSPHTDQVAQRITLEKAELSWFNPFPGVEYVEPIAAIDGLPILRTKFNSGFQLWPALIPDVHWPYEEQRSIYAHGVVKAWNRLFVGNNAGGIWEARKGREWPIVTEMDGSIPYTMVFEPENDRVVGWYLCDLFLHYRDGDSDIRHYYDSKISADPIWDWENFCRMDGLATGQAGKLIRYRGQSYIYNARILSEGEEQVTSGVGGALFRLDGERFETVCSFDIEAHQGVTIREVLSHTEEWIGEPYVFQDQLLMPGIPGVIWSYDGLSCKKYLQSEIIERQNLVRSLGSSGDTLLVATDSAVYREKEGSLVIDYKPPEGDISQITSIVADEVGDSVFIGALFRENDDNTRAPTPLLKQRKADGSIVNLSRNYFGTSHTSVRWMAADFAENGRGYFGMSNKTVRFGEDYWVLWRCDGIDCYPATRQTHNAYLIEDIATFDGDLAFIATKQAIFRVSPEEGVIREATPNNYGRYIFALIKLEDGELLAVGQWGLMWKYENGIWRDLSPRPKAEHIFGGLYTGETLYLTVGEGYLDGGSKVVKYEDNAFIEIPIPEYEFDVSLTNSPADPVSENFKLRRYRSVILEMNARGDVLMARSDGIFRLIENGEWETIARTKIDDTHDFLRNRMSDFFRCGKGVCKITATIFAPYIFQTAWMDVVRFDESGNPDMQKIPFRNLVLEGYTPNVGAYINEDRSMLFGDRASIWEYGRVKTIPTYVDPLGNHSIAFEDTFDESEYFGDCYQHVIEEQVDCDEARCTISAGDYCIGAPRSVYDLGLAQADEYPEISVSSEAFQIDENPVTRSAYLAFLNQIDEQSRAAYLPFDERDDRYLGWYHLSKTSTGVFEGENPNGVLDFATQPGAMAYCEAMNGSLCTASQWEIACRGHDDDPFPNGFDFPVLDEESNPVSDFGVRNMGAGHYEFVSDTYTHDSLKHPAPNNRYVSGEPLPMVKGGEDVHSRTCWSRRNMYYPAIPKGTSFRCCYHIDTP